MCAHRQRLTSLLMNFFFFNDTATTEIYTLSLHDALPIFGEMALVVEAQRQCHLAQRQRAAQQAAGAFGAAGLVVGMGRDAVAAAGAADGGVGAEAPDGGPPRRGPLPGRLGGG